MEISKEMNDEYYPWGGEFTACSPDGCIAVVLLNIDYTPSDTVAIYGSLKTENIGIEKIVANVISNPHIRYLVVCGDDIRGHRSGSSLVALNKNGIDEQHKIIGAPGAIPYIENLNEEAIDRFRDQVEIIDLLGVKDKKTIDKTLDKYIAESPSSFGAPYIAIQIKPEATVVLDDKRALHSKIVLNYMGKVEKRGN
jgi:tetrahydromethanopterin S-methyltransferase subunit A